MLNSILQFLIAEKRDIMSKIQNQGMGQQGEGAATSLFSDNLICKCQRQSVCCNDVDDQLSSGKTVTYRHYYLWSMVFSVSEKLSTRWSAEPYTTCNV